jgi:hypothetical protein
MKADKDWLEEVLRAGLQARAVAYADDCPSGEEIVRLVTREAGRKERKRTLDHVAGCGECAKILKSLLRISDEFDRIAGKAGQSPKPRAVLGRREVVGAIAALAGLAIVTYSVVRHMERPAVRGTTGAEVRLVSPKPGTKRDVADIELRWEAVPRAIHYSVDLFDTSLAKLWRSNALKDTHLKLPPEAGAVLRGGESYFWRVTATLDDGQEILSKLAEFSVTR